MSLGTPEESSKQTDAAMLQLIQELEKGVRSAEEEGWVSEEDIRAYLRKKAK